MHSYWTEFLVVAGVNLVAIISPGPDFALILRQSLVFGRRVALWSSVGVGTGIFLHVGYSLLGIGLLIQSSATAFACLKWLGAGYLTWLAWQGLRSRPAVLAAPAPPLPCPLSDSAGTSFPEAAGPGEQHPASPPAVPRPATGPSSRQAFVTGLLTNALNPKATLFFVALFSVVIDPHTPRLVQAAYGVWMAFATAAWFCLVSVVFTRDEIRALFRRQSHWVDRLMGVALLGFALRLAFASWR